MSKQFLNNVLLFFGIFTFLIPYRCNNGIAYIKLYVWHKIFHFHYLSIIFFKYNCAFAISTSKDLRVSTNGADGVQENTARIDQPAY